MDDNGEALSFRHRHRVRIELYGAIDKFTILHIEDMDCKTDETD